MSYRGDICDVSSFELGYFNFFSIVAVTSCKPFIDRRTPIYIPLKAFIVSHFEYYINF